MRGLRTALVLGLALAGCRSQAKHVSLPKALPSHGVDPHFVALPAPSSLPPRALLPSRAACWVETEGAVARKITGIFQASTPSSPMTDVQASSDYWASESDLARVIGARVRVFATEEEAKKKLDQALASDPRQMILRLSCLTDLGGVILMTGNRSRYRDVPLVHGHYPISAGDMASASPGEFVAQTVRTGRLEYYKAQRGELELTRFDRTGVAGSFTLIAIAVAPEQATLRVTGRFDFPCDPLDASLCEVKIPAPAPAALSATTALPNRAGHLVDQP